MPLQKLIARLQVVAGLSEGDLARLAELPITTKQFADGDYIVREGDVATHCGAVESGFVLRQKIVGSRDQILAVYVAGDIPDLHTLHLPLMDHDLRSVGPSRVAFIPHAHLHRLLPDSASLTHALWRETLIDGAVFREWVANIGSRPALSRIGHLLCELAARLEVVGLLRGDGFDFPFTQQDMADACGLSVVHVNRMLQELRSRRLIEWERHSITLLRRRELETFVEFDARYLHIRDDQRHM